MAYNTKKGVRAMYLDNNNPLAPYEKQIDIKDRKLLVAKLIKGMREGRGYKQKDAAEILGIPTTTLSGYEIAKSETPIEILVRMSYLYDVPVDYLVGRDLFAIDFGNEMQEQINQVKSALDIIGEEIATGKLKDNNEAKLFADTFMNSIEKLVSLMEENNELQTKIMNSKK